jgi:hypothetical protein
LLAVDGGAASKPFVAAGVELQAAERAIPVTIKPIANTRYVLRRITVSPLEYMTCTVVRRERGFDV